jgi:5-(carboxyamino)imidazole ribonucleotide synthase
MNYFSSDFKLGILGGGQLGKMLLAETRKFDIETYVLEPSNEAPCRFLATEFIIGNLMDFDTVYNFGKLVNLLTIEIENVNLDALEKLEDEGLKVFPSSKTLRLIQNKGIQKEFYLKNGIPTSKFERFSDLEHLISSVIANSS